MKRRSLILMLAFVASLGIPATAQGKQAGQNAEPKLVLPSFTHDFGEIKAGTPLTYSFIVKNHGQADLLIKNVAPG
jgi:hypothetical protein